MVMGRGFESYHQPNTEKTQLEMLMEVVQETRQDIATLRANQQKLLTQTQTIFMLRTLRRNDGYVDSGIHWKQTKPD